MLLAIGLHAALAIALVSASSPWPEPAGGGASGVLRLGLTGSKGAASAAAIAGSEARPEAPVRHAPETAKPLATGLPRHTPVAADPAVTPPAVDLAPAIPEEPQAETMPVLQLPARTAMDAVPIPRSETVPARAPPESLEPVAAPKRPRAESDEAVLRPLNLPAPVPSTMRGPPPVPDERPGRQTGRSGAAAPSESGEPAILAKAAPSAGATAKRPSSGGVAVAGATGPAGSTGDVPPFSGGTRGGPDDDYLARLLAWLDRHKDYPARARSRRQEGVVMLQFSIDRIGRVLDYRIARSSGHRLLDKAVVKMIRRADPLPALPDAVASGHLELELPIRFSLR